MNIFFSCDLINLLDDDYNTFVTKFTINSGNYLEDNSSNLYYYSTPNVKLYYPEPFVASGTFLHNDIWFLHIAIYQYWLWFFFIFIIVFFFVSFLITLRWCNVRIKPQRETRGVSRSKCGDLITATVPVSWACSIIIHESTDAIEYYDGFGTTEMAVGIRAYQWGWEYYYPKDIDLGYRINNKNTSYVGNSLLYGPQNSQNGESLKYLNFYKSNSLSDLSSNSVSTLLTKTGVDGSLNIWNFKNFGFSKQAIRWAYKSINDTRIFEKYELDDNFYLYSKTPDLAIYSTPEHLSNLNNFNSEWSLMNPSAIISNSSDFSTMKYINELTESSLLRDKETNALNFYYKNIITKLKIDSYSTSLYKNFFNESQIIDKKTYTQNFYKDSISSTSVFTKLNKKNKLTTHVNDNKVSLLEYKFNLGKLGDYLSYFSDKELLKINSSNRAKVVCSPELENIKKLFSVSTNSKFNKWPEIFKYAELDFKRIDDEMLLEDIYWEMQVPNPSPEMAEWMEKLNKKITSNYNLKKGNFGVNDKAENYLEMRKTKPWRYLNFSDLSETSKSSNSNYGISDFSLIAKSDLNYLTQNDKIAESLDSTFNNFKAHNLLKTYFTYNSLEATVNYNKSLNAAFLAKSFWVDNEHPNLVFYSNTEKRKKISLSQFNNLFLENSNYYDLPEVTLKSKNNNMRVLDLSSLVDSSKNLNTFNNSLWKIYRPAFLEGRSSVDYKNLSQTDFDVPIMNGSLFNTKKIVNKSTNYFLNTDLYKKTNNNSSYYSLIKPKNNFYYEFPFFISLESDSIRYSWFDWYSKSSKRVTKAMDTASYNLYGNKSYSKNNLVPDFRKEMVMNYENYNVRISQARKNYLPTWTYSSPMLSNYKNSTTYLENDSYLNSTISGKLYLLENSVNSTRLISESSSTKNNYSNNNLPSRNYWKTPSNWSSLNYYYSLFGDTTTKKTFLLSQIKADLSKINNNSSTVFKLLKADTANFSDIENLTYRYKANNKDFSLVYNFVKLSNNSNNFSELPSFKKSQYKHMRKNISNMIRIHADKAVAMPIDTRIQILTVSKDIIHSWSIPSAGIKIDCIPGYSSHKVTIFFLSGIYWGQCMEICGRFHHWMPIVVYFMKRDLFLLWCTHFISKDSNNKNLNSQNDRIAPNFSTNVSFDKTNWLVNI